MSCRYSYRGKEFDTREELEEFILSEPDVFFQVEGEENIPSKASPDTLKLIREVMKQLGIEEKSVNNITVNGQILTANGIAKPFEELVEVVYGKETTVLPEEAMHIAVELIEQKFPILYKQMENRITSYDIYKRVFLAYKDIYTTSGKPDFKKIKKEAIAKLLVEQIIDKNEGSTEKPENLQISLNWWEKILESLKSLLNKLGFNLQTEFQKINGTFEEAVTLVTETPEKLGVAKDLLIQNPDFQALKERVKKALPENPKSLYTKTIVDNIRDLDGVEGIRALRDQAIDDNTYWNVVDLLDSNAELVDEIVNFFNKTYLQTDETKRNSLMQKLKEVAARMSKVITPADPKDLLSDEDGDNYYEIDGKKIPNRVTDRHKRWYQKRFGKKTFNAFEEKRNKFLRNFGTKAHKDLENIFYRYIDSQGYKRTVALPIADVVTVPAVYEKLETYFAGFIQQFPDSVKFLSEQMIYLPAKNEAGTMDITAIHEDGTVDIFDWKFMGNKGDDIQWYKKNAYNIQLTGYEELLKRNYGVDKIGKKRIIPFVIDYTYVKQTDVFRLTGIITGSADPKGIEDLRVLPVAAESERTGNEVIDTYIDKLFGLFNKFSNISAKDISDKKIKAEQLNSIMRAIRLLQVKGDISEIAKEAVVLANSINNTVNIYNEKFKDKTSSDFSDSEIKDFAEQLNVAWENTNIYANIDIELEELLKPTGDENVDKGLEEISKLLKRASDDTRRQREALKKIMREFGQIFLADKFKISDIVKPERVVDAIVKTFRSIAKGKTKAVQVLYRLVSDRLQKIEIEADEFNKKLLLMEKKYNSTISNKGPLKDKFKLLFRTVDVKGEKIRQHKLIREISSEFFDAFNKAKTKKDILWFKTNINIEEYKKEAQERIKKEQDVIESNSYFGENEDIIKAAKKEEIKKNYDVDARDTMAWGNEIMKKYVVKDNWYSKEFEELRKPGNEAALDLFNTIREVNEKAAKVGYIDYKEQWGFIPYLHNTFSESLTLGGKTSPLSQFLTSISSSESELNYGEVDPITKRPVKSVPRYFTYDIGEQLEYTDEKGDKRTYTDYSGVSQDLFKILGAYAEQVNRFEKMSEVESRAKLILYIEENKDSIIPKKLGGIVTKDGVAKTQSQNKENTEYYEYFMNSLIYDQRFTDEAFDQSLFKYTKEKAQAINKKAGFKVLPEDIGERDISAVKLLDANNTWFRLKTLGLAPASGLSILVGGELQSIINAGKFFSSKNLIAAQSKLVYMNFQGEEGKKWFALLDYFLPFSDFSKKEQIKKLSSGYLNQSSFTDFMFALQRYPDKFIHYSNALAYLLNTVVIDGKVHNARQYLTSQPEYVNRYNTPSDLRRIEKSLQRRIKELIEKNGILNYTTIEEGQAKLKDINRIDDTVLENREQIKHINARATGNMSKDQMNAAQKSILLRSFMMFKNWIAPLMEPRFSEFTYHEGTHEHEWGRFRMTMKYILREPLKTFSKFYHVLKADEKGIGYMNEYFEGKAIEYKEKTGEDFQPTQEEFNDLMRQNIKSMLKDMMFVLTLLGLVIAMKNSAPDDDEDEDTKNYYRLTLRYLDKISDEVMFYYSPTSINSVLNGSVFPALGTFNDARKIVNSSFSDIFGEDDNKTQSVKYILKSFPVTKAATDFIPFISQDLANELDIRVPSQARRQ